MHDEPGSAGGPNTLQCPLEHDPTEPAFAMARLHEDLFKISVIAAGPDLHNANDHPVRHSDADIGVEQLGVLE